MTILEVTLAGAVLGVALVMLIGSLMSTAALTKSADGRARATAAAASIAEEINRASIDGLLSYNPNAEFPGLRVEDIAIDIFDSGGNAHAIPLGGEDEVSLSALPNPLTVEIRITWLSDQGRAFTTTKTLMHRRL